MTKSIETELKDVTSTGILKISSDAVLALEFQKSVGESGSESSSYELLCTWQEKEIMEFVTRVGFLSNKGSCEELAKKFLGLHKVFTYLHVLYRWYAYFVPALLPCKYSMHDAHNSGMSSIGVHTVLC